MLGEHLPPLTLLCKDALGNNVPMSQVPPGLTLALKPAPPRDAVAELAWEASDLDVDVSADLVRLCLLCLVRDACVQHSAALNWGRCPRTMHNLVTGSEAVNTSRTHVPSNIETALETGAVP